MCWYSWYSTEVDWNRAGSASVFSWCCALKYLYLCAHIKGDRLFLPFEQPSTLANMNILYSLPYISTSVIASASAALFISPTASPPCSGITLNHNFLLDLSPSPNLPPSSCPCFTCNLFSLLFTLFLLPIPFYIIHYSLLHYFSSLLTPPCYSLFVFHLSYYPLFLSISLCLRQCFSPVNNENCLLPWMDYGCA